MMSDAKDKLSSMVDVVAKETKGVIKDISAFFDLPDKVKMDICKGFLRDAGKIYQKKTVQVLGSAGKILSHIAKKVDGK